MDATQPAQPAQTTPATDPILAAEPARPVPAAEPALAPGPAEPAGSAGSAPYGLTPANEDYLEAIVELEEMTEGAEVKSADVHRLLNVSKTSVNKALQTLREAGCIEQERYGKVTLTDQGREYGKRIWARHRALRDFLVNDLGVDPDTADEEACKMEHTISQGTMDLWVRWLDRLHADSDAPAPVSAAAASAPAPAATDPRAADPCAGVFQAGASE